jgi:hypothetical protein
VTLKRSRSAACPSVVWSIICGHRHIRRCRYRHRHPQPPVFRSPSQAGVLTSR